MRSAGRAPGRGPRARLGAPVASLVPSRPARARLPDRAASSASPAPGPAHQRDHVGQLGHGLEVAERGQARQARARTAGRRAAARGRGRPARTTTRLAVVQAGSPRGSSRAAARTRCSRPRARGPAAASCAGPGVSSGRALGGRTSSPGSATVPPSALSARAGHRAPSRAVLIARRSPRTPRAAASTVRSIVGLGVRERGEPRLELGRRRIHAAREQPAAPGAVGVEVARPRRRRSRATGRSEKNTVSRPGTLLDLDARGRRLAAASRSPAASARSSRPAARRRRRRAGAAWPARRPRPAGCPTACPPGRRRRPARSAPSARGARRRPPPAGRRR